MVDLFAKSGKLSRLHEAQAAGYYPFFIPVQSEAGPEVTIDGRRMIMLGSNNYLGLTQHPKVKEAAIKAIEKYGSGCTGSRLMNGTLDLHLELEARLARFVQKDDAIVFATGFQTNLGVISSLIGRHDTVVIDRSDHASIVDGCRLGLGTVLRYRHNDMEDLERVLSGIDQRNGGVLIVVDGVFSMEGDVANLPEIVRLKKKYNARLLVDDAHSVGVFGPGGRGVAEHFGLQDEADLVLATFSKSFASIGGYVAGDKEIIFYIRHMARSFLFSAAIPPASTAAALAALDIIESEPERREQLWGNTRLMKNALVELGYNTGHSQSPIIPLIVGGDLQVGAFWKALYEAGIFANAAVAPAVEPDRGLIRTSYMATHTPEHLDRALTILDKVGRACGLIPSKVSIV